MIMFPPNTIKRITLEHEAAEEIQKQQFNHFSGKLVLIMSEGHVVATKLEEFHGKD